VLEIDNVTAGYGDTVVLRDVTISVPDATVVALLGPNGAGKSTTLRVASGLIGAIRGRVVLDGEDLTALRASVRARKGMCLLPEGRGIFPSLSVRENLIIQSPKGKESDSIERAVVAFPELGNRLHQVAASLSGGEQQMLALVRTIVSEPKVVLIDEASLGLAPLVVDRVFDTVRRIASTGVSLLLVEQYVTRALELADWVYVLSRGQIVSSRASKDLRAEDVFEQYLGIGAEPASGP